MRRLARELRRANPGCIQQHHTPLGRLASRLGLDLGEAVAAAGRGYGAVASGPPSPPRGEAAALAEAGDGAG
jgi:hypothetical protein